MVLLFLLNHHLLLDTSCYCSLPHDSSPLVSRSLACWNQQSKLQVSAAAEAAAQQLVCKHTPTPKLLVAGAKLDSHNSSYTTAGMQAYTIHQGSWLPEWAIRDCDSVTTKATAQQLVCKHTPKTINVGCRRKFSAMTEAMTQRHAI